MPPKAGFLYASENKSEFLIKFGIISFDLMCVLISTNILVSLFNSMLS